MQVVLARLVIGLLTGGAQPEVATAPPEPSSLSGDARFDATQLVTDDSVTDQHLLYTDLRTTADISFGRARRLTLHADVRGRISATDRGRSRYDVSRLNLEYGDPAAWTVAVGRVGIAAVNQTLVDGARLRLGLAKNAHIEAFGGLMPHPIERTVNLDFMNFGLGYASNSKTLNHHGGASVQLYRGRVDRAFLTERVFARFGRMFSFFGRVVVELVSRTGIIGDLGNTAQVDQEGIEQIDISQGYLTFRFRPSPRFDVSLSGSHVHALLPNLWWQDWVEQERARLGFSLDGPLPVGSRRSTARMVGNLHFGGFSPYLSLRYDHRHEDSNHGYEGRAGLKYSRRGLGYVDAYGAHRRSFDAQHQLAGLQLGWTITDGVNLDAGAGALRVTPEGGEATWLFDVNSTAWVDLGIFAEPLRRVFVLGMYQAFVEPDVLLQVVTARIGYRLSL